MNQRHGQISSYMGMHLHVAALLKNGYYKSLNELLTDDAANFIYLASLNSAIN